MSYDELHFGDVLQAFGNGVQLDLRLKLAVDFLKSGMLARPEEWSKLMSRGQPMAPALAAFALDVATSLLNLSAERGLIKGLPDTGEISGAQRHHLERAARAQVIGQLAMPRIAEDEQGPTVHRALMPAGGLPPRGN